jgi:methylated-DNA-[protein]-cysteine S-methyltransferase
MPETIWTTVSSPVGELLLTGDGNCLDTLHLSDGRRPTVAVNGHRRDDDAFAEARTQLVEYFDGDRTTFELSLAPTGTPFQLRVWDALGKIPYAATASYGEVAAGIGSPTASRAVGLANGRNPIAIVIPCHRVIGADGTLVGYGGGLDRKRRLLELEASGLARHQH